MTNLSKQMTLKEYLDTSIEMFKHDPADCNYQKGYEACLVEIKHSLSTGFISGLK